jgi:PAS domain-containing protein
LVSEPYREAFIALTKQVFQGIPGTLEFEISGLKGQRKWLDTQAVPFRNEQGEIVALLGITRDITDKKKANAIFDAQVRLNAIASTSGLDDMLQAVLDEAETLTGSSIGFFHFLEDDQITLNLQAWSTRTLSSMCTAEGKGQHYPIDSAGVWVDCVRERKPVIHNNYQTLPHIKGLPEGHAPVIRELVVPIIRNNRIDAIIGVGNKPDDYTDRDVEVLSQFASIACDVALRKKAELALKESEYFFKESQRAAAIGSFKADFMANFWESSEILDSILGIDKEYHRSVEGWLDIIHPDDRAMMDEYLRGDVICNKQQFSKEYRIIRKDDGKTRWVNGLFHF